MKFGRVTFEIMKGQTNRQTDRQTRWS